MIDLANETTLSLTQAARLLPAGRGGRPMTLSGILRWILKGARSPGGQVVRLDAVRLGGRWVTSKQAIQRFAEALTPTFSDTRGSTGGTTIPLSPGVCSSKITGSSHFAW